MADYRDDLFATYDKHTAALDPPDEERVAWFRDYASANYHDHMSHLDPDSARILEVGSNKGHLAKVLDDDGYRHVTGIDVSAAEVAKARHLVPGATFYAVEAGEFLAQHRGRFDAILMKAVLEHIRKSAVIPLLRTLRGGLAPGGTLIIDVPNMDWLFAPHERYMDYTHEVGFTQESLRQVMGVVFDDVAIYPAEANVVHGWRSARRRVARGILDRLFRYADGDGSESPLWARSLVAVAK